MSAFTPARIIALTLITMVMLGVAYLGITSGTSEVSVPDGARAGQLKLHPCEYETEDGGRAADCGTLVVPENRAKPGSRLIALPVTRIRARSAQPAEPIFRLEGGPGATNMEFPMASRYAERHDVVLVGYRGVDGSSRLDCPEVDSARRNSDGLVTAAALRASESALRSCAQRLTADGVDLAGYTIAQRTDDLEAARRALSYEQVDLFSESAGTRTAMIYSWRHPKSIHRSVMIGANPPGHFVWSPADSDAQLRRYAALCAKDPECPSRSGDLAATMARTAADLPDHWGPLPIKTGNVQLGSFYGLVESSTDAAPLSAPMTLDSWRAAADGDASGFWLLSLMADMFLPKAQVWGEAMSFARADAATAAVRFASGRRAGTLADAGTEYLWAGGGTIRAWPAGHDDDPYRVVRTSSVETLVISGELDLATPAIHATRELLPHLPNGHQVVLPTFGHTTDFYNVQPKAGTHLVNSFLDTGKVDDSQYTHRAVDFTPELTQTALAKGFAAVMVGLALLVLVSLLWMARRVRKRGRLGSKARVAWRSAGPLLLGLGGWFLGILITQIAMPGTPVDSAALAVTFIGTPIGLAMYLAWVDRSWSGQTKATGFTIAIAGALLGALAGFSAVEDLLALLTAIAGAAAGANLALIVRDIAAELGGRSPTAPTTNRTDRSSARAV